MLEQFLKLLGDIKGLLSGLLSFLSPAQKRLLFLGLPVFSGVVIAGNYIVSTVNYGPLYTNLSPQDGAAVLKELEAEKIPYRLSAGGSVVEVPRPVLYQTRLKLAGKGVPVGGGVGFEIFEKTPFGVSEFTQQVNYLRALQGELSRTINALAAVQSSRVHLALPSRSGFLGPEEKPSASVVVDLRPGHHLSPDQVQGIVNLIATSVPKMTAEKVTILDSTGRLLKELAPVGGGSETERLHQLKVKFEQEIERRVQTMLDPVVGSGKTIVRADVQVNFQETQLTREEFNPQNQVIRTQQEAIDESGVKAGGTPGVQANVPGGEAAKTKETGSRRSNHVTSYEIGRTTSRVVEPRGQIQRLSVAVLVDGQYEQEKYVPRKPEEMEVIKGIVMRTVGFNADRGDQVEIANVPFKVEAVPQLQTAAAAPDWRQWATSPLGIGVGVGAVLLIVLLVFLLGRRRSKKQVEQAPAEAQLAPPQLQPVQMKEAISGAMEKIVATTDPRKEQLGQIARDYHDASVRILRNWLQEESKGRPGEGNGVGTETV